MKKAFTLAEVLITLGIIGVVAAMTIPTLISNYKMKVATTRLKNFYSTIKQAVALSEIDNGPISGWTFEAEVRDEDGKMITSDRVEKGNSFANKYILPYFKHVGTKEIALWSYLGEDAVVPVVFLPNGSAMTILNGGAYDTDIYYDINGLQGPNEIGRDQFNFDVYKRLGIVDVYGLESAVFKTENGKSYALSQCKTITRAYYCSTFLKYNNWEFKEDYPYKL